MDVFKKGYSYSRMPMRRGYVDGYNNMDLPKHTMYYTNEPSMQNLNDTSRYESARRGYEEHKDMSSLNRIFDVIEADMKELKPTMTAQDIQTAKQRLMNLSNLI